MAAFTLLLPHFPSIKSFNSPASIPTMYSILTYYIASKTIDAVIQGLDETKAAIIVSDDYEELSDAITHRLGRGVTKLYGKGGYYDQDKEVFYIVVTRLEVAKLKSIVF